MCIVTSSAYLCKLPYRVLVFALRMAELLIGVELSSLGTHHIADNEKYPKGERGTKTFYPLMDILWMQPMVLQAAY
jgi:hypothetical protein